MDTVSTSVTASELRDNVADVLGRAADAGERIGVTRDGVLIAFIVSVADVEALEEYEMAQDVAVYRRARADDDGGRIALDLSPHC